MYWPPSETVQARTGQYTSLEIDAEGRAHVAFRDYVANDLCYGVRSAEGGWLIETVDSGGDVGRFASLELNSGGQPCIAYLAFPDQGLRYAEKTEGGWNIETLTPYSCSGWYCSLDLDEQDRPHISFSACSSPNLYYGWRDGSGQWHFTTVDDPGDVGLYTSLKLQGDILAVSYYDRSNKHMKVATLLPGATWETATVDAEYGSGIDTSIDIDPVGDLHVSYWNNVTGSLKYAHREQGVWHVDTIDSDGFGGYESSLVFSTHPRVSYQGATGLRYAERIDGCWRRYLLEENGSAAGYTSLAMDPSGNPRITHYRLMSQTLEYRAGLDLASPEAPRPDCLPVGLASRADAGSAVECEGVVTSADEWPGWQLQAADRSAGMMLKMPIECIMPQEGSPMRVAGVVEDLPAGYRRLNVTDSEIALPGQPPRPLFLPVQDALAGGLLVRMSGRVAQEPGELRLGDTALRLDPAWVPPSAGQFAVVTGILRNGPDGPVLIPRRADEIQLLGF